MQYLLKVFPNGVLGDYGLDTVEESHLFDSCFADITSLKQTDYLINLVSEGIRRCKGVVSEKGIEVIHGHFAVSRYLGLFPEATYAVWLRDPLERALSHYSFHKRWLASEYDPINKLVYDSELTFEQWMTLEENINLQYQYIEGDLSRFKFVGIAERFEESLSLFSRLTGFPETEFDFDISPQNVNPEKTVNGNYEIDDETRELFLELNQLDVALYRDAVNRFERDRDRCRQYSSNPSLQTKPLIEYASALEDQLLESSNTVRFLQARLLEQDKQVETLSVGLTGIEHALKMLSTQLAEKDGTIQGLLTAVGEKDAIVQRLSTELAEKDKTVQALSADLTGTEETVQLVSAELAGREETVQLVSAELAEREHTVQRLAAELTGRDETVHLVSAELAERERTVQRLSVELTGRDETVQLVSAELAERDVALKTISAQFAEQARGLGWQAARAEERANLVSDQLLEVETQLHKITETLGWRLLSRYGRIKYKFLLPVYQQFGQLVSARKEPKALRRSSREVKTDVMILFWMIKISTISLQFL